MSKEINRLVLHQMRSIFYPKGNPYIDWMGYAITDDNKPSYHHIVKACDLRCQGDSYEATLDNGAYLGKRSHELLHRIEQIDYQLYLDWNTLFQVINQTRMYPIDEIWEVVYSLKEKSESILYKNSNKTLRKQP